MKKQFIEDINDNNIFHVQKSKEYKLAAIVYSYDRGYNDPIQNFKIEKTKQVFDELKIEEKFDLWLLINIDVQNNRINKYLGLNKLLKRNGDEFVDNSIFF